jgi:hypothetical protein
MKITATEPVKSVPWDQVEAGTVVKWEGSYDQYFLKLNNSDGVSLNGKETLLVQAVNMRGASRYFIPKSVELKVEL